MGSNLHEQYRRVKFPSLDELIRHTSSLSVEMHGVKAPIPTHVETDPFKEKIRTLEPHFTKRSGYRDMVGIALALLQAEGRRKASISAGEVSAMAKLVRASLASRMRETRMHETSKNELKRLKEIKRLDENFDELASRIGSANLVLFALQSLHGHGYESIASFFKTGKANVRNRLFTTRLKLRTL